MGGMGVACVVAVFEFVWKSRKIAVEERVKNNIKLLKTTKVSIYKLQMFVFHFRSLNTIRSIGNEQ